MLDVGEDLRYGDLQPLVLALLAHHQPPQATVGVLLLLDDGRRSIQFSGLTFAPPPSAQTMNVPSALSISRRTASGRTVVSAADVGDLTAGDDQAHRPTVSV